MCFVLNMSGVLKRWCNALSCAPLAMTVSESCFAVLALELVIKHVQILKRWCDDSSYAPSSCDCEQNLLCNGYKWLVIHLMVHFSCVPLSCDCEWISFCNGYKWTHSLSYGPSSCFPLGCDCGESRFAMVTSELVVCLMVHFPVFL